MANVTDIEQNGRKTSPQVQQLLSERQAQLPIWVRAPKSGQEFYTGLTRSKLYELESRGRIKSRSIREPGQVKGTRVFHLQSVLDYIESCVAPAA